MAKYRKNTQEAAA